jgi:hypothetical protein
LTFVKGIYFAATEICTFNFTNKQKMKTIHRFLMGAAFSLPLTLYAQQAPTLQELIRSALQNNETLNQQVLENKYTKLDDEKLNDVFLPKVEITGKTGYMYTSAHISSPEIKVPAVPPVFPGAVVPEGQLSNNLNISGLSASAKAEASMVIYSGGTKAGSSVSDPRGALVADKCSRWSACRPTLAPTADQSRRWDSRFTLSQP